MGAGGTADRLCGESALREVGILEEVLIVVTYLKASKAKASGRRNWPFASGKRPADVTCTEIRSRDAPRARNRCRSQAGFLTARVLTLRPAFPMHGISGCRTRARRLQLRGQLRIRTGFPFTQGHPWHLNLFGSSGYGPRKSMRHSVPVAACACRPHRGAGRAGQAIGAGNGGRETRGREAGRKRGRESGASRLHGWHRSVSFAVRV